MSNRTTTADWPFTVELVNLSEVFADDRYQRPPQEAFIEKMVNSFDDTLVGVIDGSERPNGLGPAKYAVMDGWQRVNGMRKVGKTTGYLAVYTGMTLAEEAMFFYRKNRDRRTVHPYYSFRAKMVAGDKNCIEVNRIVESEGYRLGVSSTPENMIPSVLACEQAYSFISTARKESLSPALNMMRKAWHNRRGGKSGELIRGLGRFFQPFRDDEIDLEWLEDQLSNENPRGITNRAQDAWFTKSYKSNPVAEEIIKIYNRGRKSGRLNRDFLTKTK